MTKEIILIGGQGFAGLTLLSHLESTYDKIHILTRRSNIPKNTNTILFYRKHDIQGSSLDSLLKRCHALIYLASDSTPGSSANDPLFEFQNNIKPAIELIERLQKHPHIHLIYISSGGAIYDTRYYLDQPITENHLISPPSYYGAGKVAIEAFLSAYSHQFNHPVTLLRPSNFYGVNQPKKTGFGLIRTIFDSLISNIPINIWGDGENKRDYIYIDDFALACIACLKTPPLKTAQIFNVGSGFGYSINEICSKIEKITSKPILRNYQTARLIDIKNITLDYRQIHQKTSWTPIITLDEGLNRMWTWLKK